MNKKTSAKSSTIYRIMSLIKPYWIKACLGLILALVNVAASLYTPILIGRTVDSIISPGAVDFITIKSILMRAVVTVIVGAISQYFVSYISNILSCDIVSELRKCMFENILRLPLRYIDSHPVGDTISCVIADADQFADGILMGFTQFFSGIATIVGTLVFMFGLNPVITLVVVLVTPLSFFVAKFISSHTYNMFKEQSSIRGKQTGQIEEALNQIKVIKAFGNEKAIQDDFSQTNNELKNVSLFALFFSSLTNPCTRFVNSICYALVALCGAFSVINGNMTVGILTCFLSYATQYTKPFNEITGVITELQGAFACAARMFDLIDETREKEDTADSVIINNVAGDIQIENMYFSYVPEKAFIENFNLSVGRGKRVAIVGPTGCGKTTIINLLMRFYDPISGSIKLDGIDIKDIKRDSLREKYGMVLQDTWLRKGTIADNIKIGKPEATMEEIIDAAKKTSAHSFIRRLENGYDTVIGEDGGALSAGQKQLLCITRIMLMLPPMLILDEATSNIDTRTEIKIQNALLKLMENKTSFIVAHRLSTIVNSDIILVMKDGKIIEMGNHEELLNLNGFYSNLYRAGMGMAE